MKIAPKAAESFFTNPDTQCRAVLFYGPDAGLVRERAGRIKKIVLASNDDPFALVEIEESKLLADTARLADELLAISLMGGKRLIIIRDAGDKTTGIIKDAAPHLHDQVFLVVMAGELQARSSLRAHFEADPKLAAMACYRDETRDVQDIINKTFAAAGISAAREVTDYLAQQLGNDRYVTMQELEKIVTFAGDTKRLTLEEAQALVDYNREANLDDIVQAVADKNLQALEKMLQIHLREGTQPVAYLRALQRYFNRLYSINAQVSAGQRLDMVIANLKPKVFFKAEQSLRRHAQNWGSEQTVKALKLLIAAELACKTSDIPIVPASSRRLMQVTQIR